MDRRRMAPTTIQQKLHQEKEINALYVDTVGDSLSPWLRALCGLVHKSYTLSVQSLGLKVQLFAKKTVPSDPCASFCVTHVI